MNWITRLKENVVMKSFLIGQFYKKSFKIWLIISAKVCNAISDNLYTCCTSSKQCELNQGDCDSHDECSGNLLCGDDNCQSPFPTDADCCYLGKFFTLNVKLIIFLHKSLFAVSNMWGDP